MLSKECPLCEAPIRINQRFCEKCGECFSPCQEFKDTCNDYAKERNRLKARVAELEADLQSSKEASYKHYVGFQRVEFWRNHYRTVLERIINDGDYTAPELMKKWATEALEGE